MVLIALIMVCARCLCALAIRAMIVAIAMLPVDIQCLLDDCGCDGLCVVYGVVTCCGVRLCCACPCGAWLFGHDYCARF